MEGEPLVSPEPFDDFGALMGCIVASTTWTCLLGWNLVPDGVEEADELPGGCAAAYTGR